jgi:hypothetical protein
MGVMDPKTATIWQALSVGVKQALLSKKVLTGIFTAIANIALYFGFQIDVTQAVMLTSPIIAAIFGQTVVDVRNAGQSKTLDVTLQPPGTPPAATPSSSGTGAAIMLALMLGAGAMVTQPACGPSARQTTITTTLSAVNSVGDTFKVWDTEHQKQIIAEATSEADGAAKLAAYRVQQAKVVAAIRATYSALSAAKTLNDSHTLAAALEAFVDLKSAIDDLKRAGVVGGGP